MVLDPAELIPPPNPPAVEELPVATGLRKTQVDGPRLTRADERMQVRRRLRPVTARVHGLAASMQGFIFMALFALGWQEQRFRFAPDGTLRVQWKK